VAAEGGSTAQTDFCYAPGSAVATRRRVHRLDGSAQGAQDLVSVYGLSAQGNATGESYYGGDAQAGLATGGADLCSMGLPASPEFQINHTYASGVRATSQYAGTSFLALDQTTDASSGLVSASRDSAGIQTAFEYDNLGRMTWSKPDVGQGGWTQFLYTPANPVGIARANVTVRRRDNGSKSAAILGVNIVTFDYWGRLYQEQRRLPDGSYNKRETLYDGAGNKASVSELTTGAATSKTSYLNYDPFGRPATVRPADGAAHDVTMSYAGVRQINRTLKVATSTASETSATTTEVYDRQGRLYSVTEPSGDFGASVTTTYGYDVGSRLSSVSTPATVGGTPVTQTRSFSYDRAGLLQSETHPELGAAGNGSTSYLRYDSRGHLLRRLDGANDLTFAYDPAERLYQVKETGGAQRVLKSFNYASANATFTDPGTGATEPTSSVTLRTQSFTYDRQPAHDRWQQRPEHPDRARDEPSHRGDLRRLGQRDHLERQPLRLRSVPPDVGITARRATSGSISTRRTTRGPGPTRRTTPPSGRCGASTARSSANTPPAPPGAWRRTTST
jgi:hypothetical protein